ncbi:unnamed protein product [Staurois parvus]|uniref:Uncharacterized protein n=1 Tax=Staurois parvus TaxID=386267 RepID=A0ABN9HBU7_9NEOB|nr:unnamed protein product [Staurois parvus]
MIPSKCSIFFLVSILSGWTSGLFSALYLHLRLFQEGPRLRTWLLSEKKGVWGVFYKAAVIGSRLHLAVSLSCFAMAFYVLFIK